MHRWMILIALCLFPSLVPTPVHAVQLEVGWYAVFGDSQLYAYDLGNHAGWGSDWYPASSIGSTGLLQVSDGGLVPNGRTVTITQNADVRPGVLFEDVGSYTMSGPYYEDFMFGWTTNYDTTKLQLQVVRRGIDGQKTVVWFQPSSGGQVGLSNALAYQPPLVDGEQIGFRLIVVPEPAAATVLVLGMMTVAVACTRRGRLLGLVAACLLLSRVCPFKAAREEGTRP